MENYNPLDPRLHTDYDPYYHVECLKCGRECKEQWEIEYELCSEHYNEYMDWCFGIENND